MTDDHPLPPFLVPLVEALAEQVHDTWMERRLAEGWRYGERRDDAAKTHPCLVPYEVLGEDEREYDRATAVATLRGILARGYRIVEPGAGEG